MGIRVTYYTDEAGEHRFRISGMNGEPLAGGEGYKELADAIYAVQLIGRSFKEDQVIVTEGPGWETEPMPDMVSELEDDAETADSAHVEFNEDDS